MTAELPLNFKCPAAGRTAAVIIAVKKILFTMNKSNKTLIRFLKYWILINLCQFKVNFVFFPNKKWSKTGYKSVNFYDIKKFRTYFTR